MSRVDWEAVTIDLIAHARSKNSHGQRELLAVITGLIAEHRVPEGLAERALRLYGEELTEALRRPPALHGAASPGEMASGATVQRGREAPEGALNGSDDRPG